MAALIVDSVSVILFLFTGSLPLVLLATATAAYCFYLAIFVTKMDFF